MTLIRLLAVLLVTVTVAFAMPRYIAIPIEDLQNIAVVAQPAFRQARSFTYDEPEVSETNVQEEYIQAPTEVEEDRLKRGAAYGHSSHVDYGAYTGNKGAFGWYTDHPVGHH